MHGHHPPFPGRGIGPVPTSTTILKLDSSNVSFSQKNGFLTMTLKDGETKKKHDRVFLHRAFPFELLWQYISVLDADSVEIGVIYDIANFDEATVEMLKKELERKYYEPRIKSVIGVKERYGFSYWHVRCDDDREMNFTMQDTFRNIIRVGEDKAVLLDVDGNRFVIDSILGLDRKSYRKIELYL